MTWKMMDGLKTKKARIGAAMLLVVVLAAGMAISGLRAKESMNSNSKQNMQPVVDAVMLQRKDMAKHITLSGQTVPEAQVDISAKYAGKIMTVNVELGQVVTKGQVLITQDAADVNVSIAQNAASLRQAAADAIESKASFDANYLRAQADYDRKKTNYERYKSLFEIGAVSKEALDNTEQLMIDAKATLDTWSKQQTGAGYAASVESKMAAEERARHAMNALDIQRQDLELRAPRDGVIGYRQAEVGALAQPGQKLLSIVDTSKIYVDCQVSERDIGQIAVGMPTVVAVESLGKSYSGKVIYVSPANDSNTMGFSVRIALDNVDGSLKGGMFARTAIDVLLRKQTLYVPKEAVEEKQGKYRVFVIGANNQAEERVVTIGLRNDNEIELVGGVNEGERIAISNLARLKTGMTVVPNLVSQ